MKTGRMMQGALIAVAATICLLPAAQAQTTEEGVVYTGCYQKSSGMLRIIGDPIVGCKPNETMIQWNQVGPQGEPGPAGPTGSAGPAGATGPQGEPGPVGPQGPQGPVGASGPVGAIGPEGPQGLQGPQGLKGDAGPQGPQGLKGDIGLTGPQGLQGLKGDTGPQGPQGLKGDTGPQGPQGLKGDTGLTGPVGPQGLKGDAGPAGPQGLKGDAGPQGLKGDAGLTGPAGPQGLKGDKGDIGPQGPKGDTGLTGPAGPQGLKGDTGPQGPAGSAALKADGPYYGDNDNRYQDRGNGTVTDTVTGLIWLKDGGCFKTLAPTSWAAANEAAAVLADGQCGLSDGSSAGDWRLPTKEEWEATIAQAVALGCTVDKAPSLTNTAGSDCYNLGPQPFANVQSNFYWSSTTDRFGVNGTSSAWGVNLGTGIVYGSYKPGYHYVWPVRSR